MGAELAITTKLGKGVLMATLTFMLRSVTIHDREAETADLVEEALNDAAS
jgi:hypothetical protein